MPRHKLDLDFPEPDFILFGLSSQTKDYRLAWQLNKNLGLIMKKQENIQGDQSSFPLFIFDNKAERIKYLLLCINNNGYRFFKEVKQIDYLLIIQGNYSSIDQNGFILKLKSTEFVLAACTLDPMLFRSKIQTLLT